MATTDSILKKLSKKLPEGSFYLLKDQSKPTSISSGISTLDYALGGGFTRGWMHMLFGKASSGKSALVLQTIANLHKNNSEALAAVIDLEKSMTPEWAAKFGIDIERLVIVRPSTTEEMITDTMQIIEANAFDIVMVDSLGAGLLQSELDNDKNRMGGSAGAITRMVKAINASLINLERQARVDKMNGEEKEPVIPTVLLINQVRANLNSMFGEDTFSGGKALEHMCGTITQLRASGAAADKIMGTVDGINLRVGWKCFATVKKNKLAVPGKTASYSFIFTDCPEYDFGIDNATSTADLALSTGIARTTGNTIYYPDKNGEECKVVGRKKFYKALHDDEELCEFLAEAISRNLSNDLKDEDLQALEEDSRK